MKQVFLANTAKGLGTIDFEGIASNTSHQETDENDGGKDNISLTEVQTLRSSAMASHPFRLR
ncbi:hypothetical protein [Pseudoalteromonas sp. BDTF-M6]|uniref:hypothetical protein n=1 Tax=Pseudoalteromonas sp. BDTF-M6 TaxID=2796132 RepID=UPI0020165D27|nr:hypothetical protein [Pseudoalteromonas sp. BDTF-M6]